jgi:hypothetical protein
MARRRLGNAAAECFLDHGLQGAPRRSVLWPELGSACRMDQREPLGRARLGQRFLRALQRLPRPCSIALLELLSAPHSEQRTLGVIDAAPLDPGETGVADSSPSSRSIGYCLAPRPLRAGRPQPAHY